MVSPAASTQMTYYSMRTGLLAGHRTLQEYLDGTLCQICMAELKSTRAQCGHLIGCRACTNALRTCPYCRVAIEEVYHLPRQTSRRTTGHSSDSSQSSDTSNFFEGSADTCPPRLDYTDAPCMPSAQVHCHVCDTSWPDLYQWHEHLSQGIHRRAQANIPSQLYYCASCACWYHDECSWQLHFGLHDTPPVAAHPEHRQAWGGGSSHSSLQVEPDMLCGIQAEEVTCAVCQVQLTGLAQVITHLEGNDHTTLRTQCGHTYDALKCPFCGYMVNGLTQWRDHLLSPNHISRRSAAGALREAQ